MKQITLQTGKYRGYVVTYSMDGDGKRTFIHMVDPNNRRVPVAKQEISMVMTHVKLNENRHVRSTDLVAGVEPSQDVINARRRIQRKSKKARALKMPHTRDDDPPKKFKKSQTREQRDNDHGAHVKKSIPSTDKPYRVVEVDFHDMREMAQGFEITYNNRVARVIINDDVMIPFRLREQGHTPEKILRVKVISDNVDPKTVEAFNKATAVEKTKKNTRVSKKTQRSGEKYVPTKDGKKVLSKINGGQMLPIASAILGSKDPLSIDQITEKCEGKIQTKSTTRAIVSFYISRWRKDNIIEVGQ